MTIVQTARKELDDYIKENNLVLSSKEYEEMFIKIYGEYIDRLLTAPPKSKRKNGLR